MNKYPQIIGAYYTIEPKKKGKGNIFSGILFDQISKNEYVFINVYYTRYNLKNAKTIPVNTALIINSNDYKFKLILEPSFCGNNCS